MTERAPLTKQPGESVTQFSIRQIQDDAWHQGHDAACPFGIEGRCGVHRSPYSDEESHG